MKRNSGRAKFEVSEATVSNVSQAGRATRPATHLSVVLDVVSERDEARLELLWVESSRARLVEVQERASELLQLLVADALRVARQDLHHSTPFNAHHRRISTVAQIFISPWTFFLPLSPWTLTVSSEVSVFWKVLLILRFW